MKLRVFLFLVLFFSSFLACAGVSCAWQGVPMSSSAAQSAACASVNKTPGYAYSCTDFKCYAYPNWTAPPSGVSLVYVCPDGQIAADADSCPPPSQCTDGTTVTPPATCVTCPSGGTSSSLATCPQEQLCPDGVTHKYNLADCPLYCDIGQNLIPDPHGTNNCIHQCIELDAFKIVGGKYCSDDIHCRFSMLLAGVQSCFTDPPPDCTAQDPKLINDPQSPYDCIDPPPVSCTPPKINDPSNDQQCIDPPPLDCSKYGTNPIWVYKEPGSCVATSDKKCPDGSTVSVYQECSAGETCWDNSFVTAPAKCPPMPVLCPDGVTSVTPPAECPPTPEKCWDNSTVVPPQTCPVKPVTCWDWSVVTPPAKCPNNTNCNLADHTIDAYGNCIPVDNSGGTSGTSGSGTSGSGTSGSGAIRDWNGGVTSSTITRNTDGTMSTSTSTMTGCVAGDACDQSMLKANTKGSLDVLLRIEQILKDIKGIMVADAALKMGELLSDLVAKFYDELQDFVPMLPDLSDEDGDGDIDWLDWLDTLLQMKQALDDPDICADNPDISACATAGDPLDVVNVEGRDVPTEYEKKLTDVGECPADVVVETKFFSNISFSWDIFCTFSGLIRPLVLLLFTIASIRVLATPIRG